MARLTEEMVIARSRQSDLASVKKLNCWGAELADVTLLRRMPNVEVLALSVNNITNLADFAHCPRLRELYIRKNLVRDLAEIRHLQPLQQLTQLWLEENPCAQRSDYRMTVLRNLPNLERLDNVLVQPEELEEAMRKGVPLMDPDDEDYQQDDYMTYSRGSRDCSPERFERRDQIADCYERAADTTYRESNGNSTQRVPSSAQNSPPSHREYTPEPEDRYEYSAPPSRQQQYYEPRSPADPGTRLSHANSTEETSAIVAPGGVSHSQSAQSVKEYANSNCRRHNSSPQYRHSMHYAEPVEHSELFQPEREPQCPLSSNRDGSREWLRRERDGDTPGADTCQQRGFPRRPATRESANDLSPPESHRCAAECNRDGSMESLRRERDSDIPSAVMCQQRGFTRRPVTRNSNLLSAVLCLVKELDYPSLEVAEMAVRCRMDELANQQS